MCKHEVEHLIGTKDGIKCRLCGKQFKTFAELETDRQGEEKPEKQAEEKEIDEIITEEEQAEKKPVAEEKPKRKATSKKGAKK